jgi:ribosome-binding factor A
LFTYWFQLYCPKPPNPFKHYNKNSLEKLEVKVMATSRRVSKVASLIKREVSQMLLQGIKDDRVGMGIVSITDVNVSGDLQHAKIFVSIYGTDEVREETMAGLKSATGYVRSELGRVMNLRRTPEVLFVEDRSLERGTQMISLLNKLSEEREQREREHPEWDAENSET